MSVPTIESNSDAFFAAAKPSLQSAISFLSVCLVFSEKEDRFAIIEADKKKLEQAYDWVTGDDFSWLIDNRKPEICNARVNIALYIMSAAVPCIENSLERFGDSTDFTCETNNEQHIASIDFAISSMATLSFLYHLNNQEIDSEAVDKNIELLQRVEKILRGQPLNTDIRTSENLEHEDLVTLSFAHNSAIYIMNQMAGSLGVGDPAFIYNAAYRNYVKQRASED